MNLLPHQAEREPTLDSELLGLGIKNVIVTLGSKGARWITHQKGVYIPPFKITAVDTTAAGDAFVGSFAVAMAEGFKIEDAILWGNAAGALTATRMGAQPSLPNREEVEKLLHLTLSKDE